MDLVRYADFSQYNFDSHNDHLQISIQSDSDGSY